MSLSRVRVPMLQSITLYLDSKVTEISYTMASVLMLFAGDYLTQRLVLPAIRRRNILVRTGLFFSYVLAGLPAMTVGFAQVMALLVLEPLRGYLWPLIIGFFLLSGTLLSLKYRIKLF